MTRFGFGQQEAENDSGTKRYSDGHVDVSGKALKTAIQEYDGDIPRVAVGKMLISGVHPDFSFDQSDGFSVDWEALHADLQDIEGIGEATADELVETMQDAIQGA